MFNYVKFVATKKGMTTNFFSPQSLASVFGSGIRDPGSGMGKNLDPGCLSRIPATLELKNNNWGLGTE